MTLFPSGLRVVNWGLTFVLGLLNKGTTDSGYVSQALKGEFTLDWHHQVRILE